MRHGHPAVLVFGGFLALAAAIGIGRFAYTPILPYMVEGLGIGKSEAGLLASANFPGYLLGALAAAKAAVPGSRRLWLLSALAMSAVTTMAYQLGNTGGLCRGNALQVAAGASSSTTA